MLPFLLALRDSWIKWGAAGGIPDGFSSFLGDHDKSHLSPHFLSPPFPEPLSSPSSGLPPLLFPSMVK